MNANESGISGYRHRRRADVSQEELAMRIGDDQAYVSRIEAGLMNITLETLEQIARRCRSTLRNC